MLDGGFNVYAYANGNPLAYIDPLGLCAESGFWDFLGDIAGIVGEGAARGVDATWNFALQFASSSPSFREAGIQDAVYQANIDSFGYPLKRLGLYGAGEPNTPIDGAIVDAVWDLGAAVTAYRNLGANGPIQGAESAQTEIVHRWMSQAELDATRNTGLMRGGRSGTHYVTNAGNHNPSRARLRLALDHTPEVRVKLEVPADVFSAPSVVQPAFGMPGGGLERTASGIIPVRIIEVYK